MKDMQVLKFHLALLLEFFVLLLKWALHLLVLLLSILPSHLYLHFNLLFQFQFLKLFIQESFLKSQPFKKNLQQEHLLVFPIPHLLHCELNLIKLTIAQFDFQNFQEIKFFNYFWQSPLRSFQLFIPLVFLGLLNLYQ